MSEPFGVALLGCGTVGGGVARLLLEQSERLAARAGRPLELRHVVVRDPQKPRDVPLPRERISTFTAAVRDPEVHAVAELAGGTDWAKQAVLDALAAGKHVVTANKALLAQYGHEIFEAARKHGRAVAFEASVAGGVPIIAALTQSLAANRIEWLQGILNGTSNFILSEMSEEGRSYSAALAEAQRLGYAESDPTLDVDGTDAAHKLAILAQIAFGAAVPVDRIERRGIAEAHEMDVRFARELGYTVKLIAEAWLAEGQVAMHVSPVLLKHTDPLAQVRGPFNAIQIVGDAAGEILFQGRGAGRFPTASAVVADLIDLAAGRAQKTFQALKLWPAGVAGPELRPAARVRTRFYLRLLVQDRPGVLADVTRALANEEVSIASVIQHEALDDHEGEVVPLVIMTHTAWTGRFRAAVRAIDLVPSVAAPGIYYPVAE